MDSLANYGSDDDCDSGDEKSTKSGTSSQTPNNGNSSPASRTHRKPSTSANNDHNDANYDEVQMDLSEDSNDSKKGRPTTPPLPGKSTARERKQRDSNSERDRRSGSRGREEYRRRDRDRSDRRERHRDYDRDKDRDRRDNNRYGRDRRDRRQRSRSRDRNRSRRSRSPRRSRSRSRDRRSGGFKRFDRASSKLDKLDKMGIELRAPEIAQPSLATPTTDSKSDSAQQPGGFFMPGISGKFREQIERRKLLWQKKNVPETKEEISQPVAAPSSGSSRATKVWECTTFAQDTDGKVANKFKRLMGIKATDNAAAPTEAASDLVKKRQEEMFSSMEQQYEVARSTTHTMRGMGLGFGSFPR